MHLRSIPELRWASTTDSFNLEERRARSQGSWDATLRRSAASSNATASPSADISQPRRIGSCCHGRDGARGSSARARWAITSATILRRWAGRRRGSLAGSGWRDLSTGSATNRSAATSTAGRCAAKSYTATWREPIPGRRPIHERGQAIDNHESFGRWAGDLLQFRTQRG
jgi:hypothetical protein